MDSEPASFQQPLDSSPPDVPLLNSTNSTNITFHTLLTNLVPDPLQPFALFFASSFDIWVPSFLSLLDRLGQFSTFELALRFTAVWISISVFYRGFPTAFHKVRLVLQAILVSLVVCGLVMGFVLRGVEWYYSPKVVRVLRNVTVEAVKNLTGVEGGNGTLFNGTEVGVQEDEYDEL